MLSRAPSAASDLARALPDTVAADSAPSDSLRRADSLRATALRADSLARARDAARPDFRAFWPRFLAAAERGPDALRPLAAFSDRLPADDFAALYARAFEDDVFTPRVRALTARDFRREGTARSVSVLVGFDSEGAVVPQDEAVTESSVTLAFEIVGGAYRLVEIASAG